MAIARRASRCFAHSSSGGDNVNPYTRAAACLLAASGLWGGAFDARSGEAASAPSLAKPAFPDHGPSLAVAVESAWRRAVAARESDAGRMRAEADSEASRRWWAAPPSVEASHRDDRLQSNAGRRETELGMAWPMWLPGQRAAGEAVAQAGLERVGSAALAARLQLAGLVRESAWRLLADATERALFASQADVLHKLYDDVEKRVKAGDLARADALAARAEWLSATAQSSEAQSRLDESRIRWEELTGLQAEPTRASVAEAADATGIRPDHPEIEAAVQAVAHARRRLDLVRASTRDNPELKLGVRQDVSGGAEGTHHSLTVGVRVPLGTRDRNRPLEAAALGELDVAQAQENRLRQRVQADVAAARSALDAAQRQLAVEQERAKLLRDRASLVDRSFRAGETALPELLRAIGSASQADAAALRQEIQLERARARLLQAMGIQP